PHMHLRGEAASYVAFYPDGTEEVLLDVPVYDFNWQTNYFYKEPKEIPAGTRIEVSMWFNNSPERGELANLDSRRAVRNGGPTTDEMMLGWIDYTETKPMAAAGGTQ
ncbi:alkyl hydroperoxide reductase, partial [Candidatus Sumerlaeota bacterium]|nr:alkyl hydroperoxide reductase [Candidatus Sumerlaeota bacterium]